MQESFLTFLGENLQLFLTYTGVYNATPGHLIMILVGLLFIFLAIKYEFEPMLLIPIGFGILIGNIPFKDAGLQVGIYEQGSVLNILYQGVTSGWYPPLIFLGIGAMILSVLFCGFYWLKVQPPRSPRLTGPFAIPTACPIPIPSITALPFSPSPPILTTGRSISIWMSDPRERSFPASSLRVSSTVSTTRRPAT